jgi:hypothetical protein
MALAEMVGQEIDGELSSESTLVGDSMVRDYKLPEGCRWRFGKPDYSQANKLYKELRALVQDPQSLSGVIQNLFLNFLVESHHVEDVFKWKTTTENFQVAVCGGCPVNGHLLAQVGLWNIIWGNGVGNRLQTAAELNENLRSAFPDGLAFEVLEAYSGPPSVSFKFRFFGVHAGIFKDGLGKQHAGSGKQIDFVGMCIARVNQDLAFESIDFYGHADGDMLQKLCTNTRPQTAGGA